MPDDKRRLESTKAVSTALRQYYKDIWTNRPLAWSVVSPNPLNDICQALGIQVAYPENYACVCAAQHLSEKYCTIAEANDYKPELCSYIRNNFGYLLANDKEAPLGGMPEPDLITVVSNACLNYLKWFDSLRLYFNKPIVVVNTPHQMNEKKTPDYYIGYVRREIEEAIGQLEEISGNKATEAKLKEVSRCSREQTKYWMGLLELNKAVPAPLNFPDLANLIFVPTSLSGSQLGVNLLRQSYEEVKERVSQKIGAIPKERHRLLLLNIPPWYRLGLSGEFAERGCVFPFGDYTRYVWCTQDIDDSDPIEHFARKALGFGHAGYGSTCAETLYSAIEGRLAEDIREYKIDGAVAQINKSCKVMSTGVLDLATVIREKFGLPVVVLDADQADERFYSDAEVKLRLDAFFEMLGEE
jgi:benzoyl-CoA reductase/2-hydroxyglutaryl-CoA dehydratase subunit BcrC/BadD/HgdB